MTPTTEAPTPSYTKKDFESDQTIRWCPGCGDYAILSTVQAVLAGLGIPREEFAVISGIGCSSRFPYYLSTYGFHSIHGRAPAIATGVKLANPKLSVWVITGDGDGLSIGGNHLLHALRRNIDLKILMFNNRIYGLTKGQYSPTSEKGKVTKSTPYGSVDNPVDPVNFALAAGATFVARSVDVFRQHLADTVTAAAMHRGAAFVEIYQNCNIFNDGAFESLTAKATREEKALYLEHGQPLRYGADKSLGFALKGAALEKIDLRQTPEREKDLLAWDAEEPSGTLGLLVNHLPKDPANPVPLGIFRRIERPTFDGGMRAQIDQAKEKRGPGNLEKLLYSGTTWTVS
jgi:2-oxoglutarate ferredoxin oxidoreductase subunit beta